MGCCNYFQNLLSFILISKAGRDALEEGVHLFQFSSRWRHLSLKFFSNSKLSFIALTSYENLKKTKTSSSFLKTIHFRKKVFLFLWAVNMNVLKSLLILVRFQFQYLSSILHIWTPLLIRIN